MLKKLVKINVEKFEDTLAGPTLLRMLKWLLRYIQI